MTEKNVAVHGALFEATPRGFEELVRTCNLAVARGRHLMAVVQLGSAKIGAIFVQNDPKTGDSFFEEVL